MVQMTLFPSLYRYIIDTSSILSQKPNEPHRRQVYRSLWRKIDEYIKTGIIVTCSEVAEEIKDETIREWLHLLRCTILDIDDDIQRNVKTIVTEHPKMIDFTGGSGTSSGDAFLIATAMKYNLTIITEENPDKLTKIPQISRCYGIESMNITGLFDTSVLPFEDCCTVFTPKHPKTRPETEKVEAQEAKLDIEKLEDEAFATLSYRWVSFYED